MRDYLKNKLGVPDNWDKYDYQTQRYSFEDVEEILKTYKKEQLRIGSVSKSLNDDYTPTFEQYRNLIYKRQGHNFLNKETQRYMDYGDMETRYNWHLKNL